MSENVEVKMIVCAGELRRKIEEAGKLLAAFNDAKNAYYKCRGELDVMMKDEIDDDVPAYAATYWAIRSHDKYDEIDPIAFLKRVTHKKPRSLMLSVKLGVAREELDQADLNFLVETLTAKETTLHVNKIMKEGG